MRSELACVPDDAQATYYHHQGRGRPVLAAERAAGSFARNRLTKTRVAYYTGLNNTPGSTLDQAISNGERAHRYGRATSKTMPLPAADGRWLLWSIALWRAAQKMQFYPGTVLNGAKPKVPHEVYLPRVRQMLAANPRLEAKQIADALGLPENKGPNSLVNKLLREAGGTGRTPGDDEAREAIAAIIAEHGRSIPAARIKELLRAQGLTRVDVPRIRRLAAEAGARAYTPPPAPAEASWGALEPRRWDGLVTTTQVAEAFGVTEEAVTGAVLGGHLTPVGTYGDSGRERNLFDPKKITGRRRGYHGPVDIWHPDALPPTG